MKKLLLLTLCLSAMASFGPAVAKPKVKPHYQFEHQNPRLSDDQRIDLLLKELTLEEKVTLLSCNQGVPRLGLPAISHYEGLHGLTLGGAGAWNKVRHADGTVTENPLPTTVFPQAYGLGETWDIDILHRVGQITAEEARWYMQSPLSPQHSLVMRAPNADLARDPRWGRTEESFGEDAFLTGSLAASMIRGLQGPDKRYWKSASLMKHFLANSNEDGRDSTSSDFDNRLFREYYSRPFYMGVKRGGSQSYMDAYNAWNGRVMMVHPCNDTIVRQQWGMKGIICSDGSALNLLINAHHAFPTSPEGVAATVKVTLGQFLSTYREAAMEALDKGLMTETDIDRAIRGNLYVALRLGFLDGDDSADPYRSIGQDTLAPAPWLDDEVRDYVREVTAKSVVLLKNDGILPLRPQRLKKVAVIGQWANDVEEDWYGGTPAYSVTILQGLREALGPDVEVSYARDNSMGRAVRLAREADVVLACVGNHPYGTDRKWKVNPVVSDGREAVDRKSLQLPDEELLRQLHQANANTVLVLVSSFPYTITWSQEHLPAIVHITHCSQEQGNGLADILTGRISPAGRTTQTWVRDILDLPEILDYDIRHGRTYMYNQKPVLYPFGHGLSYTSFDYQPVTSIQQDKQTITLTLPISNVGQYDSDEVVQVYAQFPGSKVSRPIKQLCAFTRVPIPMKATIPVTLTIQKEDLTYWDESHHAFVLEPGQVELLIGASSEDIRQHITVTISNNKH